jgi:hypothetical protein
MENFPRILITKNNDTLSLLFGGKHYLFQGDRVESIFDAAMMYKNALYSNNPFIIAPVLEELQELITPILRKDIAKYFTTDGKHVYLGQTNIPVPTSLFELIQNFIEKKYDIEAFTNFWRFCLMNPNTKARDDFFEYCKTYGITITDKGYAVLYKAVNKQNRALNSEESLAEFVSTSYLKVKRWKKSPKNYFITEEKGLYNLVTDTAIGVNIVGNLQELHDDLDSVMLGEEISFKPGHHGRYGMDIRLGTPVTMPRQLCDSNIENDCSYGLHIGSFKYVKSFGQRMDTILACLVNPMDIVALPQYDTSKIRCCRYMPYAIIERDEHGTWTELESELFDEDFIAQEDAVILQAIHDNPSTLTQTVIDDIVASIPQRTEISEQGNLFDECLNYLDNLVDEWENDDDDDNYEE